MSAPSTPQLKRRHVQSKHPAIGEATTLKIQARCRGETTSGSMPRIRLGTEPIASMIFPQQPSKLT